VNAGDTAWVLVSTALVMLMVPGLALFYGGQVSSRTGRALAVSPSGWLARRGAQDWAGGLVVHASAGAAVLALLLVIGRRRRWPDAAARPHSVPLVVLGAGLLWFGWFGFNGADGLQSAGDDTGGRRYRRPRRAEK
jgi:ammonia channel protein AmtB